MPFENLTFLWRVSNVLAKMAPILTIWIQIATVQGNQLTDTHTCALPPTAWCRPRPWRRCEWRTRPTNCLPAKPNLEVGSESSHLEHLRAGRGVDPVVAAWLVTLHFAVPDLWPLELPQALELMLLEIVEVLPLLKVTWVWVNLLTEDF